MQVASTNLNRGPGNTKNSLYNWVQLTGVNVLLVLYEYGTNDLCGDGPIFICLVHGFLH